MFFCPGCGENHAYLNDGRWTFNNNFEKPTFFPSLLYKAHEIKHANGEATYSYRCHLFITDGKIRYLKDCTHALAGQLIDVPDWED